MSDAARTLRHSACLCPNCGHVLDASTVIAGTPRPRRPDDVSICFYCQRVLIYLEDGAVRLADAADIDAMEDDFVRDLYFALCSLRRNREPVKPAPPKPEDRH